MLDCLRHSITLELSLDRQAASNNGITSAICLFVATMSRSRLLRSLLAFVGQLCLGLSIKWFDFRRVADLDHSTRSVEFRRLAYGRSIPTKSASARHTHCNSAIPKPASVASTAAVENIPLARRVSNTFEENRTVQTWGDGARP